MGRIVASVTLTNYAEPSKRFLCDALVDTGSAYVVLPAAWRERLGQLQLTEQVTIETADQRTLTGEVCGPVRVEVEGFRPVSADVLFVEMEPKNGGYEPLLGYIVLEAIPAAVDMLGHRLVPVKHIDFK